MKEENRKEEAAKEEQSGAEFGEIGFGKGTGFGSGFGNDFEGFGADNGFGKGGSDFADGFGADFGKEFETNFGKEDGFGKEDFPVRIKKRIQRGTNAVRRERYGSFFLLRRGREEKDGCGRLPGKV